MSNAPVLEVLKDLIERAEALGIEVEAQTTPFIENLQEAIQRREAAIRLSEAAERLQALPDSEKPTPEEIDAEIKAYRASKRAT